MRSPVPHLRQPEVEHLDYAMTGSLDIRRLDVAMNNPLFVRRLEGVGDLTRDGDRFVERHRPQGDPVRERGPVHQLQHQRLPDSEP